ncbi:MAG: hypothetical protein CL693_06365 [Cellvibrionaceae bacterium]|nr:hypothetical protein [Cellvibrionaceae bacterium]|tara:strand:+ start:37971 stop:40400 length:2430 start_codon:yes stop_codon:yes gene_type:complete
MLRLWLRRFLVALLLLAVTLPWLISSATRYWIVDWIEQQGAQGVDVAGFWLNPYSAVIELDEIELQGTTRSYRLSSVRLELLWRDLWRRKVHITTLAVAGVDVSVDQMGGGLLINGLNLGGEPMTAPDTDVSPQSMTGGNSNNFDDWNFAIDQVHVEGVNVTWGNDSASVLATLNTFSMTPLDTETETETELYLDLQLSQLNLNGKLVEASSHINYTALLELQRQGGARWKSLLLGNLIVSDTQVSAPEFSLTVPRVEVGITSELNIDQDISNHSSLEIQISEASLRDSNTQELLIDFQNLALNTRYQPGRVEFDNLVLSGFNFLPKQKGQSNNSAFIEEAYLYLDRANVELPTDKDPAQIVIDQVTLAIANVHVQRNADGSIEQQLRLQKLQDKVTRGLASLSQAVSQSEKNSKSLATESSTKSDASLQDSAIGSPDDEWAGSSDNTVNDAVEQTASFLVQRLTVESEVDVLFVDHSLSPEFTETLSFNHLDLENIAVDQTIVVDLDASLSYGAKIKAAAELTPQNNTVDGEFSLKNYELIAVSGYSEAATGYQLEAGRFNLSSDFSLEGSQLNSEQDVLIDQLSLRVASSDSANSFIEKTAIPMEQAVDLLRDSNNQITLNVPIHGDLNSPDIRLQQVINTALRGAMRKASLTVLSTLIQPYGAMISIAKLAGDQVTKVRFDPVPFEPGQFLATTEALAYVDKVGTVVRDRDSLKIKLCGVTNQEDSQYLRQQALKSAAPAQAKEVESENEPLVAMDDREALRQLGEARALALRNHLLKDIGVSEGQLLMCLPKHLASSAAGVELSI